MFRPQDVVVIAKIRQRAYNFRWQLERTGRRHSVAGGYDPLAPLGQRGLITGLSSFY